MDAWFTWFRLGHIVAGAVALFIGPLAMATVKGGRWHRRWGKIYFWAMAAVAATATVMCWLRSGLFLFLVGVFSFYLALTGYTVLRRKTAQDRARPLDWVAAIAMLAAGIVLVVSGERLEPGSAGRAVRSVFGGIGLVLGGSEVWQFLRPSKDPKAWLYAHMTRFLAAYIATVTAFVVVNFTSWPALWRWLGPTLVGTIGITVWRTAYAWKFAKQPKTDA
jgi:uncharacterized membrane protein